MIHPSSFPIFDGMEKTIIDIFNLFSYQSLIDQEFYTNFSNYLIPDHVPNINHEVIHQIEKSISSNIDFDLFFVPIKSQFVFRSERINSYIDNFSKISKNQQLAAIYLMYSVISFLVIDDLKETYSSFPQLMSAIFKSEQILPRKMFVFSVSSCLVHFLNNDNSPFTLDLAKQIFPIVTNKFFNLFSFVLLKTLKSTEDPITQYLFQTFIDSVLKSPKKFEKCDLTNLVPYLSQKVGMFDPTSLDVIDCLSFVKKNDRSINECLESIPIFILHNSKSEFKLEFPNIQPFKRSECVQLSYQFEKGAYFTHGMNPLESEIIDRTFSIDFDTSDIMKSLNDLICKLENDYVLYFFDHYTIKNDTSYLVYVRLLQKFGKRINSTKNILKRLFHPLIFAPSVSLFDYNSEYDILYQFRKVIFNILLQTNQSLVTRLLKKLNFEPLLFCEFIGRLHLSLSSFNTALLTEDTFITSIVQIMMIIKNENSESYQKARATLILFIISILKDESNIQNHFYGSTIFVNAFFTSIFEPLLHSIILNSFLHFLQKFNSSLSILKPSISMISSVIDFCEDEHVALSILQSFTESLSVNPKIATSIGPFINSITAYLYLHPSQDFLNETVQLYLHSEHKFEMRQIRDLSDSIHKINGDNDPDDQLVMNLLCLISSSPSVSLNSRVLILNEQLLIAFFSLFQTAQKAKPVFEFLFELCKFSTFNCYQCSKAELDVLCIEMIKNYPNKFTFHGCQMNSAIIESKNQIIDILCYLVSIRTSPSVCIKTISLFEENFESTNIMNSLLSYLSNLRKNIQPIGYFNSSIFTNSTLVNGKNIDERFTFQCWIKIDSMICHRSDSLTTILQIVDGTSELLILVNNNGSLIVKMLVNDDVLSAMFMNRFPPEKSWNLITVAFKRLKDWSCALTFSINCERPQHFTVEFPHFSNNSLKTTVGKLTAMKPIKSAYPVFIGDFFFYSRKLKKDEINNYYRKGEYAPNFVFRNEPVNKSVFPNFLDHFISKEVHLFVLPYIYLNDNLPNLFIETLLDILKSAVVYRGATEIDFKSYAYALKRSNQITFSLYQKFFSMLDSSLNQKTLKSLVYDILLNFKIWKRAKSPNHLNRIVQNWGNILFNACPLILTNFALIYSQIGLYFSFDDPNNENLDLHLYRQNFDKLLFSVSTVSFSYDNALAIISNCAASQDTVQNIYDLKLLLQICMNRTDIPLSLCKLMFYFLRPNKEEQFVLALKIIYAISKEKIFKFMDSILCIFNEFYFTQTLLDLLIQELNEFPVFYPIIIFIAMNISNYNLKPIASILKNIKIAYFSSNWLLMPLLLYSKTKSIDVIMFCASNVIDHFSYEVFDQCLSYIDFLSCVLNINFEEFSLNFAKIVVDFANCQNTFAIQHLFMICTKLLLTNTFQSSSITPAVLNELDCNSFYDKADFEPRKQDEFDFKGNFQTFIDLIQTNISDRSLYFRVSSNPLLLSSLRLFKKAVIDVPLYKYIYLFFQTILKQSELNFNLAILLNSIIPVFFEGELKSFARKNYLIQSKLVSYWLAAKKEGIEYMTSFGSKEASIAVTNSDFLLNNQYDKIVESKLRKVVLSEFSIWADKKLYLTQIRRVFKYSKLLHQIRLKKSDNANSENVVYSPEPKQPTKSSPVIENLTSTSESSYGSGDSASSNPSIVYQLKYNYPTVDYVENNSNEPIIFKSSCLIIKIDHEIPANFVLKHDRFIITTQYCQKVIMLFEIRYVFRRDRFQLGNSLEFILTNGRSYLLDFSPLKSQFVMKQFKHLKCKNLRVFQNASMKEYFEKTGLTEKWQNRKISNFEYLMALNIYCGRTFNDANLYPIFPWIMTTFYNYEDQILSDESFEIQHSTDTSQDLNMLKRSYSYDFNDKNEERNLKKPIAVQNSKKYDEINMKFDKNQPISHTNCFFLVAPSTTAMVSHWLIRQPPFTQLHCRIEDGKFGYSARLFQSMNRAAHQALRGSISWELCPEFYSFPEMFVNLNNYEMGDGVKKDIFPIEKAIDFVYFHRKMLENEHVSENLNHWIDMIFGCKTKDIPSGNVYTPIICDDVWKTSPEFYNEDFIILTISTSGQLPRSLFAKPHPQRLSFVSPNDKMNTVPKNVDRPLKNLITPENGMNSYEMKIHRILAATSKLNLKDSLTKESIQLLEQAHHSQQDQTETESNSEGDLNQILQINHALFVKKIKSKSKRNNEIEEEYLFLIELADGFICTLYVNFDKKSSHLEVNAKRRDINEENYSTVELVERSKQKSLNEEVKYDYSNFTNGFIISNNSNGEIYLVRDSAIEQINTCKPTLDKSYSLRFSSNSIDLSAVYTDKLINDEDCEFDSISASGDAFCLGNSDGHFEIHLLNELDAPKKSIDFLYERVACFCYSQSYDVIICGCNNGSIYIIDSETGQVSFSHQLIHSYENEVNTNNKNISIEANNDSLLVSSDNLNESQISLMKSDDSSSNESSKNIIGLKPNPMINQINQNCPLPVKILITEGFGFIVVYCDDMSFYLLNINGFLIRSRKVSFEVERIFTFKSCTGFDYIVAADSRGGIRICEAFYLDFNSTPIYSCRGEVVSLGYDLFYDTIIVGTKCGKFFRIPACTLHPLV